jgi:uncharacterized cysteine cluster protein YcgN (CxxCxxCC family)
MTTGTTDFVLLSAQKPAQWEPCNGCGACCQNEACKLSRDHLGSTVAPCIALEWHNGKYRCGLLIRPAHYIPDVSKLLGKRYAKSILAPLFGVALGVGKGCDAE